MQTIHARLKAIALRQEWLNRILGLGWSWSLLGVMAWALMWLTPLSGSGWAMFCVGLPALATASWFGVLALAQRRRPAPLAIARNIEAISPHLDSRLITAVEQEPDLATGRFTVLQQQVIHEAVRAFDRNWPEQLAPRWKFAGGGALAFLGLVLMGSALASGPRGELQRSLAAAMESADEPSGDTEIRVEPGDAEVERGSSALFIARFPGDRQPTTAVLRQQFATGAEVLHSLSRALDDPVFGTRLTNIRENFVYRIQYDQAESREYRLEVYDLPQLSRSDLVVQFPLYTGQGEKRYSNATQVTVVEQSQVTLECHVNKPLAGVHIEDADQRIHQLQPRSTSPLTWTLTWTPEKSTQFHLHLVDDRGRRNRDPEQFRIEVVPNLPPKMELTFPGKDVRASSLEELQIEGRVTDDFGLEDFGLVVAVSGQEPVTRSLGSSTLANRPQLVSEIIELENLKVQPDDLVTYYLYATDRGPDGQLRKVTSDLFFAEIRPFEEVYRQMEGPPGGAAGPQGGQSPGGNAFENLVQVQKQIVTATWNLIRQSSITWPETASDSVTVVAESQAQNQRKLLESMIHLQDATQQRIATAAVDLMDTAKTQLQEAASQKSLAGLDAAVLAEQSAYRQLLKLRAREHLVMQSQQSGGGGSSSSANPNQQQLQNLELSDQKNRYETQRAAGDVNSTAQQEDLGTLDRLKELAQRQGDLNEKLRELDAALRLTQSSTERAELERQLKRLRDEQQQLLQDADELRNRLSQSQRQEQFQEAREQLEDTREKMVDATEALREGQLSQAISSSSRAERELQNLQDDFRQQTSARFAEALQNLRESARELNRQQQQLSAELTNPEAAQDRPMLRQGRSRQKLQQDFEQQRTALQEVLDGARQIVQDAERAEPLLSQQLYETIRKSRDDQLETAMEAVPQLLQRGFLPEAQQADSQVRQGLDRLQAGVERAAESVLGSEVEALKRARSQLAELSQQLQQEIQSQQRKTAATTGSSSALQPDRKQPPLASDSPDSAANPPGATNSVPVDDAPGNHAPGDKPNSPGAGNPASRTAPDSEPNSGAPAESPMPASGTGKPSSEAAADQASSPSDSSKTPGRNPGGPQGSGGTSPGGETQQSRNSGAPGGGLRAGQGRQTSAGTPSGLPGGERPGGMSAGPGGQGGPISGSGYREWSERLRDVETMVSDPALQAEVSRLRDQARSLHAESQRHSETPNWELVQSSLYQPMLELQRRLAEEVAKRDDQNSLVPIDRDPVPARFKSLVQKYYEQLGQGAE